MSSPTPPPVTQSPPKKKKGGKKGGKKKGTRKKSTLLKRGQSREAKEEKKGAGAEEVSAAPSSETVKQVKDLLGEFRASLQKEPPELYKATALLNQLKILLIQFQLIPPFDESNINAVKEQLELARSILELACTLSIKAKDYTSFKRHVTQVKAYYTDYSNLLDRSEAQWQILGLNLLGLLAHNNLAEFHSELELIAVEHWENLYINYPLQLEQRLMEGNYNKVLRARKSLPLPDYEFFADMLVKTVREKISDCCEKAYEIIPLEDARQMLMLENKQELNEHIFKRNWTVQDGALRFTQKDKIEGTLNIPSDSIARQTLAYATELERIV